MNFFLPSLSLLQIQHKVSATHYHFQVKEVLM